MTIDISEYDEEAIADLEGENADLRAQNERLQAALASVTADDVPAARSAGDPTAAADAGWKEKYAAARTAEEVMAIRDAELQSKHAPALSESDTANAIDAYHQALLELDGNDPNYQEKARELHMAVQARLGEVV